MRRILVTVLCLMFSIFIIAQEKYKIQLYDLNYRINNGVKNNTSSNISITIKYEENNKKRLGGDLTPKRLKYRKLIRG